MTMRCLLVLALLGSTLSALAQNEPPKHMVQITRKGLGVGAAYEKTDPRSESKFEDFDILRGEVDLNYAYTLRSRLQLGVLFSNHSEKRSYKTKTDKTGQVEVNNLLLGFFGLWNFSDDLTNSWYSGFMFSVLNHEDETTNKSVFNYLEDDKNAETYELLVGKRFSLSKWGLQNITYSPTLSFYVQRARKDYEDDGLQDNMALNVELIKFDVIF